MEANRFLHWRDDGEVGEAGTGSYGEEVRMDSKSVNANLVFTIIITANKGEKGSNKTLVPGEAQPGEALQKRRAANESAEAAAA